MKKLIYFLSLFGSIGTLFCCALPFLLVSLGAGAVFATFTSFFPQIYWLTTYKIWLFLITGILLAISYFLVIRSPVRECPLDESKKQFCKETKKISRWVLGFSIAFYSIGLLFAYILPSVLF